MMGPALHRPTAIRLFVSLVLLLPLLTPSMVVDTTQRLLQANAVKSTAYMEGSSGDVVPTSQDAAASAGVPNALRKVNRTVVSIKLDSEPSGKKESRSNSLMGSDSAVVAAPVKLPVAPPVTAGNCFHTKYGVLVIVLVALLALLSFETIRLRIMCSRKHTKNAALRKKITVDKAKLAADQTKLKEGELRWMKDEKELAAAKEDMKKAQNLNKALIDEIAERGRVYFDLPTMRFSKMEPIDFTDVEDGLLSGRVAQFSHPEQAALVLDDLAGILKVFLNLCLLIEAHTSGGKAALSEVGHEVADARAELISLELMARGVEGYRLDALGVPGALGSNKDEVVLWTCDI